jgi:hypothetical protein
MKQVILSLAVCLLSVSLYAQQPKSYNDLLKEELKEMKTMDMQALLGINMDPNTEFGKLYQEFQTELLNNGEKRFNLISDYMNRTNNITPEVAKNVINQTLDLSDERNKIMRKYAKKMGKYLSPENLLALMQYESKLRAMVDAELAEMIPFANQK